MIQKKENVSPFSNASRNSYVRRHITEALVGLLKEKPMQEISISEITERAGVGRMSFYRNYNSKEDVVRAYLSDMVGGWEEEYKASGKSSNSELYGSLFSHLKERADFFLLLEKRNLMNLFLDVLLERAGPKPSYDNFWAYTTSFIAYGTYGWIREWIARGMKESAETMAATLSSYNMK